MLLATSRLRWKRLTSASRKASGTNRFFQSYSKELPRQTAFLKATLRVMTEGFLKPNAKTAFFKAILKFCTANQLFKNIFCLFHCHLSTAYRIIHMKLHTLKIKSKPRAASNPDPTSSSPAYWPLHQFAVANIEYNVST